MSKNIFKVRQKSRAHRKFKIIYKGPIDDMDESVIFQESFGKLTPVEKFREAWKMVQDAWKLKGRSLDELRFDRTTALIKQR